MNRLKILVAMILLSACSSNESTSNDARTNNSTFVPDATIHALPTATGDASCFGDEVYVNAGDLFATAKRIVVGEIEDVSALPFAESDEACGSEVVNLTVRMSVTENLKGEGTEVQFNLGAFPLSFWGSDPRVLRNDVWVPDSAGLPAEPVFQVTTTLGWTGDTGLQPGQTVLAFLWGDEHYSPIFMPLATVSDAGGLEFQSIQMPGSCLFWKSGGPPATLDDLRSALAEPGIADPQYLDFSAVPIPSTSWCTPPNANDTVTQSDAGQ